MIRLKRRAAWTVPMMLQAALMSGGALFAGEEEGKGKALARPVVDDVLSTPNDEKDGRPNPDVRKTRVAKPKPERIDATEVREVEVVEKGPAGKMVRGGRITVTSVDGKTYEIVTSEGPVRFVQDKAENPPPPPRKPGAGRALTIIRTADGEEKIVESGDIDTLINDLTFRMKDKAGEAPKLIIGVSVSEAPDALMAQLGRENDSAVVVDAVMDESPAAKAGVRKFDVILKAGGESVSSAGELTKAVKSSDGRALGLVLLRSGKEMNVEITPRANEPIKAKISDGTIHFGPAVMDRKMIHPGDVMFGPGPMLDEIKALRKDVAELKKMVEELRASK